MDDRLSDLPDGGSDRVEDVSLTRREGRKRGSEMRVTRKMLGNMLAQISRRLGAPPHEWEGSAPQATCNVGALLLEASSPGDGWTRYQLGVICSEGGGQTDLGTSRGWNAAEAFAYLRGVEDGIGARERLDRIMEQGKRERQASCSA